MKIVYYKEKWPLLFYLYTIFKITVLESTNINVHNFEYSMFLSGMPVCINVIPICSYVFIVQDVVQFFEDKCLHSFQVEQKTKFGPELSFLIFSPRLDFKNKNNTYRVPARTKSYSCHVKQPIL